MTVINAGAAKGFAFTAEGSDRYGATVASLTGQLGLTKLGLMVTSVPPGKRAFPKHNHLANDEAFVILEGTGVFRIGETEVPVSAGDICAAPRGGPETAHQLVNTGATVLKYIGISSSQDPDVVEYPESGKFAVLAIWPGQDFRSAHLSHVGKAEDARDYWEGET